MGPTNGIIGDEEFGTTLPQTEVPDEALTELRKTVRESKSPVFKDIKKHLEERMAFYQTYMPNGDSIAGKPAHELGPNWVAANIVIGEFKAIIAGYEGAADMLKAAENGRRENA